MVNLRSKSKARAVTPHAVAKTEQTFPSLSQMPTHPDLSKETLQKLTRAQLQKLAKDHKVKANQKSEVIIEQLSNLQPPKKTRAAEDNPEEELSRKRIKRKVESEDIQVFPLPPPGILPDDEELWSGTESEMTEEEQPEFATPVSSRSGTPPPATAKELQRLVEIIRGISQQNAELEKETTKLREQAAKHRKKARAVRELTKAEAGRTERMSAYFMYWKKINPKWDRDWVEDDIVPEEKIRLDP